MFPVWLPLSGYTRGFWGVIHFLGAPDVDVHAASAYNAEGKAINGMRIAATDGTEPRWSDCQHRVGTKHQETIESRRTYRRHAALSSQASQPLHRGLLTGAILW